MVEISLEKDSLGRLTCALQDGTGRAVVTASNTPEAAADLIAALDSAERGEVGECFWQEGCGQYRWLLRRNGDSMRIVVLWSIGAMTGWENVFWSDCPAEPFARRMREEMGRIGLG